MKVVALSFLIGATGVFLACRWAQGRPASPTALGRLRGSRRGGRHGRCARRTGFAVTALFKQPVGHPDPAHRDHHSARRTSLGEGLGTFRAGELPVAGGGWAPRIRDAQIPSRLGQVALGNLARRAGWPPSRPPYCGLWWKLLRDDGRPARDRPG